MSTKYDNKRMCLGQCGGSVARICFDCIKQNKVIPDTLDDSKLCDVCHKNKALKCIDCATKHAEWIVDDDNKQRQAYERYLALPECIICHGRFENIGFKCCCGFFINNVCHFCSCYHSTMSRDEICTRAGHTRRDCDIMAFNKNTPSFFISLISPKETKGNIIAFKFSIDDELDQLVKQAIIKLHSSIGLSVNRKAWEGGMFMMDSNNYGYCECSRCVTEDEVRTITDFKQDILIGNTNNRFWFHPDGIKFD